MTPALTTRYEFERLPLEPIPAGTNILLSGPSINGTRQLLLELLADNDGNDGVMLVSTDDSAEATAKAFEDAGGVFDTSRTCVLDCTKDGTSGDGPIREVSSPADLTGIGMEFSSLYESLLGREHPRARIGLDSVSTLLMFAEDFRAVFRFLHTLTSRIRTGEGLGVATIDPEATDQKALGTISQAFDARFDVREGGEFRVRGLDDQPDGWLSVD
jgi:hypothetical protein